MGCPESLEFHRKYNHSSTGPPKYLILAEFTKNSLNFTISGRIPLKLIGNAKYMFLTIPAGSGDPCEELPLLNLCNLLCFTRPGHVVRSHWARRGISAISKKLTGITGESVNSQILMILGEINTFSRNCASGPFRIVDNPEEILMFSLLGRRTTAKSINGISLQCRKLSGM